MSSRSWSRCETVREEDVPAIYSPHYYRDTEHDGREHLSTIDQLMPEPQTFDVDGGGNDWVLGFAADGSTGDETPPDLRETGRKL